MFLIHLKIIFHCRVQTTPELNLNLAEQTGAPEIGMFSDNPTLDLHDYEKHFIKTKICCPIYNTLLSRKSVASFLEIECHRAQDSPDTP